MEETRSDLEKTVGYVDILKEIIADQRADLEASREVGRSTASAEKTLEALEISLNILEEHERLLRSEIEQEAGLPGDIDQRRYGGR